MPSNRSAAKPTRHQADRGNSDVPSYAQLFLSGLAESTDWLTLWQSLLEDETFIRLCQRQAAATRRKWALPADCESEITQEIYLSFADLMRRRIDLGFDPARADLARWIGFLVYRCSRRAATRVKRANGTGESDVAVTSIDLVGDVIGLDDSYFHAVSKRVDLIQCINQLDDPLRIVMTMHSRGRSSDTIANTVGRSPRTVYRMIEQGTTQLRRMMLDHEGYDS